MVTSDTTINVISLPCETWRPIPGFAGYFASSAGRIASAPERARRGKLGGLLKQNSSQPHRARVSVSPKPGWPQTRERVARLVCLAFCGPRPSQHHTTARKDGDATNNSAENLFWRAP